jgi:LysR family transcriptional regulator, transcriptional activator of nhaA
MPALPDLNYHQLRYFWTVAREGSIAKACAVLHVSQPTISEQLRNLAKAVGSELFVREGRRLRLTDTGRLAQGYADEIFALGRELNEALAGNHHIRGVPVAIGIGDGVPKLIATRLVEPALQGEEATQVTLQEDRTERLMQRLATHELDLVVSDAPLEAHLRIRAYNHLLGETQMVVFGAARYARLARGFPKSLDGVPVLASLPETPQRRAWDSWCADLGIAPRVVAQVQDSALMKTMGQAGFGVFAGPAAIAEAICRTFEVRVLGNIAELRERYYAISLERRLANPVLKSITAQGRNLFS